jgi:hypothetical protein
MTDRQDPFTTDAEAPATDLRERQVDLAQLQRVIARGFDVEAFMRTDVGRYIRARASKELEDVQDALLEANAFDANEVRQLQLKGLVAARVLTYFADIVKEAEAAEQTHAQVYAESNGG